MSSTHKVEAASKTLSKIALEPSKRIELWAAIERRIGGEAESRTQPAKGNNQTRNRPIAWRELGVIVAGVVIFAVGVPRLIHHNHLLMTNNVTSARDVSRNSLTESSIRQYYTNNHRTIARITTYPSYHADIVESSYLQLGQSVDPTSANTFDWWDVSTGQHYTLAGAQYYMSIDKVVSANEVVFLATGAIANHIMWIFRITLMQNARIARHLRL